MVLIGSFEGRFPWKIKVRRVSGKACVGDKIKKPIFVKRSYIEGLCK